MDSKYLHSKLLYEDSSNNMNRVVRLDDGSLFTLGAIKKDIANIGNYHKRQFIFSRKSYDQGKTWSLPQPLFEIPETQKFADISQFMISKKGFLHVFMYRIWKYNFEKNEFKGDILHARMDDTDGTNLKVQKVECLDRYTGALNNLIQLKSSRIVVPFSTLDEKTGVFQSSTIYSDDEGITWKASNLVDVISEETHVESGAVEPVVAEVDDNKLVMIIRTVLGSFYYSISNDGGASWSDSKKSKIKSSNSPAVLQKLNDGRILISWNNCNGMPMRGVRYSMARQCLHAAISDDGLKTLKGARIIVNKENQDPDNVLNCYPFSAIASDDEIFLRVMTVQSKDDENWHDPGAKLILLETDFLNETEYQTDPDKNICIKAFNNKPGYKMIDFPYGQKGKLEMQYEGTAEQFSMVLADNYIDGSNFNLGKDDEQYLKYIEENYTTISVVVNDGHGVIKVEWDTDILIENNGKISKIPKPKNIPGFNHLGILVPDGEITIKEIHEKSEKAWIDTGIEY